MLLLPRAAFGWALALCAALSLLASAAAQSTNPTQNSTPTPTPTPSQSISVSTSLSLTTTTGTSLFTTTSGRNTATLASVYTSTFNATHFSTATLSATASSTGSSASTSASASATPITLDTKVDPAFGVLGGLLVITGLPSAFLGHKNRWTSFFLMGFYTLSLTCFVLITRFGILPAINPPSKLLRGMFVLSSAVAGIVGGGIAIFFWKATRYGIGAWGGFAFGLWIQCFRAGGLIGPIGYRYIMLIACAVVGFTLATIAQIHYYVVIVSTAIVGASAFMLGIDCFTTGNLKEFYMWNLGFKALFPKFTSHGIRFPISQLMQIELGLMGAVALMGIAVQLRVLKILHRKLEEIKAESRRRDEEEEARAAQRFAAVDLERDQWEKEHGRKESGGYSSDIPLMRYQDTPTDEAFNPRARKASGLSEFIASPRPEDELLRNVDGRRSQTPAVIPALDLGIGIEKDVPEAYLTEGSSSQAKTATGSSAADSAEANKKQQLLAEIQEIRKSIADLKDVKDDTLQEELAAVRGRRQSLASRRTLSQNLDSVVIPAPSHLRPPREQDPRGRVQSVEVELSSVPRSVPLGEPISRPASEPVVEEDWNAYVRERKLMQPPSGVTPPIPTSTTPSPGGSRMAVPPAVEDALADRRRRENAFELGEVPLAARAPRTADALAVSPHAPKPSSPTREPASPTRRGHRRGGSSGSHAPVTILPPAKKGAQSPTRPTAGRTHTFEELQERHREKINAMQTPLSDAERERANLEKAKARWERSKTIEREAVTKRQAERAAAHEKEERAAAGERGGRRSADRPQEGGHRRSLSADKLAAIGGPAHGSARRQSTLKVEDWQQRQQTGPEEGKRRSGELLQQAGQRGQRASVPPAPAPAPAPAQDAKGRRMSGPLRDPPS